MDCCRNFNLQKGRVLFYRGVNEIFPSPHIPSLYYPPDNFYENEDKILNETISIFPDELLAQKTTVEKLILIQHYGFPTRIINISKNVLVALFFACFADKGQDASRGKDGIIYVYEVAENTISFCDSDTVSILANIAKRPAPFKISPCSNWREFNEQPEIKQLGHEIRQEKSDFDLHIDGFHAINSVVCLRPRMNNPRIIRQDGCFFLFGVNGEKKNCSKLPQEWIKTSIIIPAKYKERILDELDSMNINEGFVYPDFEHINNAIRRRYSKKA
jgi:hypothetical protein